MSFRKKLAIAAAVVIAVAVAAVVVTAVVVVSVVTASTGGVALAAAGVAFGTACGGLVGGIANESKGESFINGWAGVAAGGLVQSTTTAVLTPLGLGGVGTIVGGGAGSGIGTVITENLNNRDKPAEERKSAEEIRNSAIKSAAIATVMSTVTAGVDGAVDYAQSANGYNSWAGSLADGVGMAPITAGFGEMLKGFFSCVDDAIVYILS